MSRLLVALFDGDNKGLTVDVTYTLTGKKLGLYKVEVIYPNTLQLARLPEEIIDRKIWIPNPLREFYSLTTINDNEYLLHLFEGERSIYKLIFKFEGAL